MRLLLVDDHRLFRESVLPQVAQHPKVTAVDEAENAESALAKARECPPDLVLMDIDMPGLNPFDATRSLHEIAPGCKVVFLTGHDYDSHVEQAIATNAAGYVVKHDGLQVLMDAISRVSDGGLFFSDAILERIVVDKNQVRLTRPRSDAVAALSRRERELLALLGKGATLKEAAAQMQVSYKTADNQKTSLMRKLGIHDRVELARFAIREGLVSPT
ncbi:MAG TPA: response regulator transcription factor [Phycisphaerae bacterium]|jgi:DNA-binding NarL/FixJ family response regulator|nr:response regulator transcription factor [Phycisphaerae bacterium]